MDEVGLTAGQWRQLFDAHPAIMLLLDPVDGGVVAANRAAEAFYGYDAATLTTLHLDDLSTGGDPVWRLVDGHGEPARPRTHREVAHHRTAAGRRRRVEVAGALLPVDGRELLVVVVHDVGAQRRLVADPAGPEAGAARAPQQHQATHDQLTGLVNRDRLIEEVDAFVASGGDRPRPGALVLLDLIGMAGINDRVGHRTGDVLLRAVARRLEAAAGQPAVVARTSGDEFGVLLPTAGGETAALAAAQELARVFEAPFATPGGGTVLLRARFGAASTTTPWGAPAAVVRDANLALSATQASRTARIRVCDDGLRHHEERRLRLEYELSTPTITDEFRLAFQPVIDLTSGRVPGLEALLLWDHPELGTISPVEFVPLAEHNGAIVQIGAWVLRRACEQLAAWDRAGVDPELEVAVNVSARQLLDVDLVPTLAAALDATGLPPQRIALEITETALADDSDVTTATVGALAELGTRIHIDDFGTGYSSFAQLGRFPFHGLKIDRSFITPLGVEPDAEAIVAALLAIASAQGLEVIAEGVDAEVQAARLRVMGCQLAQGYLWSPPLAPDEVPAFLAARR